MHWKELEVWKLSHEMVLDVYRLTSSFPDHEKFRLISQLCRAASSVPANIVEGNARYSRKEYIQFLVTARASLEETRYHSLLTRDLCYLGSLDYDQFEGKAESISRMLNSLIRSLRVKGNSDRER
ncbi:MAG: four helix bundle protein [Nitrospirota bacterium]|nr:four helix bundle protein [Nitrospirota bacterium]MDE3219224.1 four helix bundle protein [Nitrospirota bacterium]